MSIVKDGEVLFLGGFGVTRPGGDQIPNGQTIVPVQSVTKPMTSLAVGMLVDDGLVTWDEPIRTYIPEFEASDPLASAQINLRDLLSHRSVLAAILPGGIFRSDLTNEVLLRELADAPMESPFRDRLFYSQPGLGVVGEIIKRQTGSSWSDFMEERVFGALEMTSTFSNARRMVESLGDPSDIDNLLWPAVQQDGQVVEGRWRFIPEGYCPAGCVVTTAEDMIPLMDLLANGGIRFGDRLVSEESLQEAMKPHTVRSSGLIELYVDMMSPTSPLIAFGMGWGSYEAFGHTVFEHPGSGRGSSVMAIVPEARLGVFVSSNATWTIESDRMVSALKLLAIETALGQPLSDWISLFSTESR
jgi:CubicO group peptidase (beta-lactamase class C family)